MLTKYQSQLITVFIFFISLIFFTWGISSQEIIGFDSRFYLFVQEMYHHGLSWFPLTYHHAYPDYLSSSTSIIYFISLLTGLNKLTAILPTAILAAITVTLTYHIGNSQRKYWGLYAIFFMFLTSLFIKSARAISLDMYTTAITTACFYCISSQNKNINKVYAEKNSEKNLEINSENNLRKKYFRKEFWIYPLIILGFIFRGPIGLVIPTGVICVYYFLNKQYKNFFTSGFIAFFLLLLCTALLLFLAYQTDGYSFMQDVLHMQIQGRIDVNFLPRYFYITNSFGNYALAYPLACLVFPGMIFYAYTSRSEFVDLKFLITLFGWMFVILLGMSIPGEKKVRYILPMLPAISLSAAYPFVSPASQKYFLLMRKSLQFILFLLPGLFLFALIFLVKKQLLNIDIQLPIIIFSSLQLINIIILYFSSSNFTREIFIFITAVICFMTANIFIIEPEQLNHDKAREFVINIETLRKQQHASLIFYKELPDTLPIKYLVNMSHDAHAQFIYDEKSLMAVTRPAFFVSNENNFKHLSASSLKQIKIKAKNTLGHVQVVVFARKK